MDLDDCDRIFDVARAAPDEASFCHVIEPLFRYYPILSIELGRGNIFWRARIIETEPYRNVDDLDYPPSTVAGLGRLNDRGTPCFYISSRRETALAEVQAAAGQRVQLAGFRIMHEAPLTLAAIGEYANVEKNGYMHFVGSDPGLSIARGLNAMPVREAQRLIYIDRFFAAVLADPDASNNGYRFSRALGAAIHARNAASGIVFPSVRDPGGFNLAIKAKDSDRSFHNVCCLIAEIGKRRQFGFLDHVFVKSAERLDDEGNFVWKPEEQFWHMGVYNMTKAEFDAASLTLDDPNALLSMLNIGARPG